MSRSRTSSTSSSSHQQTVTSKAPLTLRDWLQVSHSESTPESRLNGLLIQAEQSLDNDNVEDAIKFYTKALNIRPNDPSLYSSRAYCNELLAKHELSLTDAEIAIKLQNDCTAAAVRAQRIDAEVAARYKLYESKCPFLRKGRALAALNRSDEALDALNEANKRAVRCLFLEREIRAIKLKVISPLNYDREDVESVCDQFDTIQAVVDELSRRKRELMTETDPMPTNPFRYCGLYVNGLNTDLNEKELEKLLCEFGTVLRCRVYLNDYQSRAVVTFAEPHTVRRAVQLIYKNKHKLTNEALNLVIRYRHTWLSSEEVTDPQSNFKGDEIAGECYKWRNNGCAEKGCKFLHIPVCKNIDQQNVDNEAIKRKRTPIKFVPRVKAQRCKEFKFEDFKVKNDLIRRLKIKPIVCDSNIDDKTDKIDNNSNDADVEDNNENEKIQDNSLTIDNNKEVVIKKEVITKRLKIDYNNRTITTYNDIFD